MRSEKEIINSHIEAINNQKSTKAFENDLALPNKLITKDKKEIEEIIQYLEEYHAELFPYVKNLKKYINNITKKTRECVVYLILGQLFKNWEALFVLSRAGMDIPMMNILRLIKESCALVNCITLDDNYQDYIDRWFKGEKIKPWEIRKSVSGAVNNHLTKKVNFRKMQGDTYNVESYYAHVSYVSILESVNVFTRDFDYIGSSMHHFTNQNLKYAISSMDSTALSLKSVYTTIIKDCKMHDEIDEIYNNHCDKINFSQDMINALKRYEL